ncbi:isocitrate/isopropylmalate dehydrogenase family protein [Pelagibius litoralis]|uniref:3-isopropylmalate dehydrogenase n=1 Tax=Pelagibius litoralis TaxID=374515 RepID=A0A967EX31_9PROT|nr:isocitrate/isopropylmalate family dehydrogenase [Pelagibius litoralis]NIA67430.1 isocitrate/isopropylmalate dehydrogenase family protein [Pelagibius litoralis]
MSNLPKLDIAVFEGDGIGNEITEPSLDLLSAASEQTGGFELTFKRLPAGAGTYRQEGIALPKESLNAARAADAIFLAAMGLPDVRYPDGTEVAPQLDLRFEFNLYAGVRPVRSVAGLPPVLADPRAAALDFVLIRESTEGLFASRGKGVVENDQEARDTQVITRPVCERLFDFAFDLAAKRRAAGRPGGVTCVDKANVFTSFAFFRQIFDERAALHSDIDADRAYVDATALNMIRRPWDLDVLVTENMFGDILSDLAAGLIGGMGLAPSADIGDEHAVFQPCHGSAPDIVGQGKANPTAMFLSAAMMLEWLAERHSIADCARAGAAIRSAVDQAFGDGGLIPADLGGSAGTVQVTQAVMTALRTPRVPVATAI